MSQETTIITGWEVVKYGPESDKFPVGYVQPHIFQKEVAFARKVFGKDFYAALKADLVDYGTLKPWDAEKTYSDGDYAEYFGTVIKSIQDSNTEVPCEDSDNSHWVTADKFQTACYETLWQLYLRRYLAFLIIGDALDYATYPSGAKGVIENFNDNTGTRSASFSVFTARKRQIQGDASQILENMLAYMKDENEADNCDFSEAAFISCATESNTKFGSQTRRFFIRTNT